MSYRVLIAASGTGGHLFPALYITQELENLIDSVQIEFCGSGRPLEEQLIGSKGYKVNIIPIVGVSRRGLKGKLEFLIKLPNALCVTFKLLRSFKPQVIIGVGGYISVLPVLLGRLLGIKTIIHEAEIKPGLANKFLSFFANLATVASPETKFPSKIKKVVTGQPINPKLYDVPPLEQEKLRNILVLGGSQGSNGIDKSLKKIINFLAENNFKIKHQARKENIEELKVLYQQAGVEAEVLSFIDDMSAYYSWSGIVICRAGLNTVQELAIIRRPTILIPLPGAPEQKLNAEAFAKEYQALIVNEADNLIQALKDLMSTRIKTVWTEGGKESAARKIAKRVNDLVESN